MTKDELRRIGWEYRPHDMTMVYEMDCHECGEHCRASKLLTMLQIVSLDVHPDVLTDSVTVELNNIIARDCKYQRK